MIFRTINWRHNDSAERLSAEPVSPWKTQHNFTLVRFPHFRGDQACAVLGKITEAAADQTLIMRAVADDIKFGARDRVLKRDRIENPSFTGTLSKPKSLITEPHPGL
jgi:hypothetical protein